MSDIDEPPPSKVTKIEMTVTPDDTFGSQDNGQEEWLSEGVLTDDGFDAGEHEPTASIGDNTSQDNTMMQSGHELSADTTHFGQSMEQDTLDDSNPDLSSQSIEATLRQLSETQPTGDAQARLDAVSEYLVQKPRAGGGEGDRAGGEGGRGEGEDGNNTDELLQMLGDDKPKKKIQVLKTLGERQARASAREAMSSNDDDDDSLETMMMQGARVTRLRVAQNAVIRKYPAKKALPEALSDSEMSSDEAATVKKIFKTGPGNVAAKSTSKQSALARNPKSLLRPGATSAAGKGQAAVVTAGKPGARKPPTTSTPLKQYRNTSAPKTAPAPAPALAPAHGKGGQRTDAPIKTETAAPEEVFEIDEDSDEGQPQRLMRPERMDEDMMSTDDSDEDDDCSFYNELPSSESDDIEEWFALDVRAERAGDYIPLLGHKAFDLLTEEKKRVESKLGHLRCSITDLAQRSKLQSAQIEEARQTLAELDTLLVHG